jgi:hypothetical protein
MIARKLTNVILLTLIATIGLALVIPSVSAKGDFSIDAKINTQKLNAADKLKVVASANGDTQVKNVTGKELKSKTTSVSFRFNQKNGIVTVGKRDEYFVCAYALNTNTNKMKSYACVEGNMEQPNGKNIINIGSGSRNTLSTGSFQTVKGKEVKDVTLRIGIPLSDRKEDVKDLKVVTMIKGELKSKTIDAQKLLKKSDHNTLFLPFHFNKNPDIGPIRVGDLFFACVSADELNPPEGTECEHREMHTGHIHNLLAR